MDLSTVNTRSRHVERVEPAADPRPTPPELSGREMSRYIVIQDYDAYEDQHPFYEEMTGLMTQVIASAWSRWCASRQRSLDKEFRILELGAGTGIFTKSLATALPHASIVAVEVDHVCARVLMEKMAPHANVRCEIADSTTYRERRANIVVTSFADHHIPDAQKRVYFTNIGANMLGDGLFISGEEFLPDYDEHDDASRDAAIVAYHRCILDRIANHADAKTRAILSELESAAMRSGLERQGDFKISAAAYRRVVTESGFMCTQTKLGPMDRDDVGGVFVSVVTRT